MRLIDADALKASIPETETDIFENCQRCTTLMDYEVKDLINAQPTIPAPRWRRVEEELPDDSRDVIIFTVSKIIGLGSLIGPNWYQWYSGGGLPVDVTHWMEKPEPPKEDEHGN